MRHQSLKVSTERFINMGCDIQFQSDIVRWKTKLLLSLFSITRRDNERRKGWLKSVFSVIATFSYIMTDIVEV